LPDYTGGGQTGGAKTSGLDWRRGGVFADEMKF